MKKRPKWLTICLILFILAVAALYILIYTIPKLTGALEQTAIVRYGDIKISLPSDAVVIRDEQVVYADIDGKTGYYIDENTKTRKGTKVLDIYGEDLVPYKTSITGVVSYFYDGYEEYFSLEDIRTIESVRSNYEQAEDGTYPDMIVPVDYYREEVKYGDPLYKIITSDTWYTALFVSEENLDLFNPGKNVTIVFDQGEVKFSILYKFFLDDNSGLIICSCSKYFQHFAELRQCIVDVIVQQSSGLIVPSSSIGEIEGERGIYVKNVNGDYIFKAVTELLSNGTESVIKEENVKVYDEILKEFKIQEADN